MAFTVFHLKREQIAIIPPGFQRAHISGIYTTVTHLNRKRESRKDQN